MSTSNDQKSSTLAAGTILQNRYRVVRLLGKGGMGAVYEALDLRLETTVALKETFSTDDHLRKQFEREARMLAQLHHPSLPRVSDYFTEGKRTFLVMQFIEGVDLAKIIAQQPGPFPRDQVVAWADQLLDALVYLHSRDRQVIHRDIKPHNLKLTPQGQIALLDFGLAKVQQPDGATSSAAIFGYTKQYAPLEQMQDQATSPQSDIYALGATLYHLLTGVKPPDALTRAAALVQHRPDPLRPANEVHKAIGEEIATILNRAMAQSAEDRYASASDFRDALRRVGRVGTVGASHPLSNDGGNNQRALDHAGDPLSRSVSNQESDGLSLPADKKSKNYKLGRIAIIVVLFAAASASVYRSYSQHTESSIVKTAASSSDATASPATSTHGSKSDRSSNHRNEDANTSIADPSNSTSARVTQESPTVTLQASNLRQGSGDNNSHSQLSSRFERPHLPAPREPNVRFPNLAVQQSYPTQGARFSPPELRPGNMPTVAISSTSNVPAEIREAQVLRARDGTQIVKFSDGTTRVFRPGERSAHSNTAPK